MADPEWTFGRTAGDETGTLTDLGCPDCRGVLAVRDEGRDERHLTFTCRVGHSFSAESLLDAKETQVEEALWSAIEVMDEIAALHEDLIGLMERKGLAQVADRLAERAARARKHGQQLREILSRDGPVETEAAGSSETEAQ